MGNGGFAAASKIREAINEATKGLSVEELAACMAVVAGYLWGQVDNLARQHGVDSAGEAAGEA